MAPHKGHRDERYRQAATAVCDVFDALISERPYKRAMTVEAAAAEIERESGTHFDPRLVALFKRILPSMA